jgi:hypothetical protein
MKNKRKKQVLVLAVVIILIILGAVLLINKKPKSETITQEVEIIPLSPQERQVVANAVLSSEFVSDLPEKYPIAIFFFDFENGERRWRDGFLVGPSGLLSQGEPEVYIIIHAKYIPELASENLCEVMRRAYQEGDIGVESQASKVSLLLKYAGMLKHRDCLGI